MWPKALTTRLFSLLFFRNGCFNWSTYKLVKTEEKHVQGRPCDLQTYIRDLYNYMPLLLNDLLAKSKIICVSGFGKHLALCMYVVDVDGGIIVPLNIAGYMNSKSGRSDTIGTFRMEHFHKDFHHATPCFVFFD